MDYRSLFSETELAADRALAKPAEYAAYKKTFNESLKSKDPFFGKMASEEWMNLHMRHCELHLSFVVPTASAGEQN